MQLAMFAATEIPAVKIEPPRPPDDLANYAFLYTATATGAHSGIRFMMTTEDAKIWCSSPLSRGKRYKDEWSYFFTTVAVFVSVHWGTDGGFRIDLSNSVDDGSWDERIASTGAIKITIQEASSILQGFGYDVIMPEKKRIKNKALDNIATMELHEENDA